MNKAARIKFLFGAGIIALITSCSEKPDTSNYQQQIDSLQNKLADTYKPGLGEFMSSIQVHHNKLWFAGTNSNWDLADFETHEIMESLDDIRKFASDRKEVRMIGMIDAPIDSVNSSIQKKDTALFRKAFVNLTNTCNNCHRNNDFGFNVVKIPETPPFSNQDFK